MYLPQANGWCKNNVGCASNTTNGNSEQCYSIFYSVPKYGAPFCWGERRCPIVFLCVSVSPGARTTPMPRRPQHCLSALHSPGTFNYSSISTAQADFNSYAMTYYARLYLMDLDVNGAETLTSYNSAVCAPLLPEAAFVSMVRSTRATRVHPHGHACARSG